MNTNMENLEAKIAEERKNREESVLAMLFDASRREDAPEDPRMAENYEGLSRAMEELMPVQQEEILKWVALIHRDAEWEGFDRGLKLGHKLKEELG